MPSSPRPDVLQIAYLRRWAIFILGQGTELAESWWTRVAACTAPSWALFLRAERCALPLRRALGADAPSCLPQTIVALIDTRVRTELQRTLSATAQLHAIATIAKPHDWRPVILKGGVLAASDHPVDLQDVDVLLPPDQAPLLAQALDAAGHTAPLPGPVHHLAPRARAHTVPVEIHHRVSATDGAEPTRDLIDRATPLPDIPTLWRLAPEDHLWHVLTHHVLSHPDRRGRLRDLVVLTYAIAQCTPDALARIDHRVATHRATSLLGPTWRAARAMHDGTLTDDPFAPLAIRKYTFLRQRNGRGGNVRERALQIVCGDRTVAQEFRHDWTLPLDVHSALGALNWLTPRAPRLAGALRQALRVGRLGVALGMAVHCGLASRRLTREWRQATR